MSDLRSKFKGAKLSAIKDVQKDAEEKNKSFYNADGRLEFLQVDDGRNVFRLMPPHPDDKTGSPYLAKRTAMLRCEVEVYEGGEATGKTEVKFKNIFIATQHGGFEKDPIELYIDYARKRAEDEYTDKKDRQSFLAHITGYRDKKGVWNWGITPKTAFVCYAVKNNKMGRFELYDSWIKEMDKLAITSDEVDDVMRIDPFSDPNEGFPIIIDKSKNAKGKTEYIITKDEPSRIKRESWEQFFERTQVTDAQLEELLKQKPLSEFYGRDIYTKRDFELAIDGLRRFDEEHKYQIFENEEFMEELAKIEELVPEPKDGNDDIRDAFNIDKGKKPATVTEETEYDTGDVEIDYPGMKRELKKYIRKEYGDEFVDQLPKDNNTLEVWYALYVEGDDLPINKKVEEKKEPIAPPRKEEPVPTRVEPRPTRVESSGSIPVDDISDEIAKLRARRANRS